MSKWNKITCAVAALILASHPLLSQSTPLEPVVQAALDEGKKFEQRQQLTSALDSDRKALKLAKGKCSECLETIVNLQLAMELPKDAASSAATWAAQASTPKEKAHAEYIQASALLLQNKQKHNDALLTQADEVLNHASTDDPSNPAIHLLEGRVLAALKKESDAKAQFQACAATPGATPLQCRRANAYAQDISLTTNDEAPEFTIARPDGTPVTLDSLGGKVVLIDFWATWCGPCAKDLDYVQSIAEEFEKDNFVLLGISIDENEAVWKSHIAENRMIGIQVRDNHNAMHDLFHVSGVPTYLILDSNGIIRYRATGDLKDLRTRVRAIMKETAAAPAQAAADTKAATLEPTGN